MPLETTPKNINPNATYNEIVFKKDWEKYKSKKFWKYRKAWEEAPKKFKVLKFPLCLDIETTTVCNLKCPMCPRTTAIKKGLPFLIKHMEFSLFKKIINEGSKYGLSSIKMMYLGEPLAHPDVTKQIRYAKKMGITDVILNTNGTLLTPDLAEKILAAGLDRIFFSFDSIHQKTYESIRVGAKFDKVVKNIKYLCELKNKKYPHVQVRVSMVVMPNNESELDDYRDFWKDTVDNVGYGILNESISEKYFPKNKGFACAQLWQRMFVRVNGDITVCCTDYTRQYVVGNAKKENLADIWRNKQYKLIRNKHKSGNYYDMEMCKKCEIPYTEMLNKKVNLK